MKQFPEFIIQVLFAVFSACCGIRTGSKLPVLRFDSLLSRAGLWHLGKGWIVRGTTTIRLPDWANGLFYPIWNRSYGYKAFRYQCGRLPSTDLHLLVGNGLYYFSNAPKTRYYDTVSFLCTAFKTRLSPLQRRLKKGLKVFYSKSGITVVKPSILAGFHTELVSRSLGNILASFGGKFVLTRTFIPMHFYPRGYIVMRSLQVTLLFLHKIG